MTTTTVPSKLEVSPEALRARRRAAVGALGFAISVFVQNAVLTRGQPFGDAPLAEVAAFFDTAGGRIAGATGVVAINVVFLLLFAANARELGRDHARARSWLSVGFGALVGMIGVFLMVTATQIALVNTADGTVTPVLETLWALHGAAFAINMPVLGTGLAGMALGLSAAGVTPSWQGAIGVVGGALMIGAGVANVAVAAGSPIGFVGFAGFGLWIVWLLLTGVRLLRRAA